MQHRQNDYYFGLKKHTMCIYGLNRKEKCEFLNALLISIFMYCDHNDEVYFIDDLGLHNNDIQKACMCIEHMQSFEEEKMRNFFLHIKQRNHNETNKCIVLISDYTTFKNNDEDYQEKIIRMLECCEKHKVMVILCATTASSIPYRMQTLLQERISLKNDNLQELMAIFEQSVKKTVVKNNFGMCKQHRLLDFAYPYATSKDVSDCVKQIDAMYGSKKPYHIKVMPDTLLATHCTKKGIPLGCNIDDYSFVTFKQHSCLLVLSTYNDEYYTFYTYLKQTSIHCVLDPNKDDLEKLLETSDTAVFTTLHTLQQSLIPITSIKNPILYIGTGFKKQYIFQATVRKELKPNEAVYFELGRNQVIRLVETK